MNKQKFTQLVKDYQDISADDRHKLQELVTDYPYSQIIHTLVAKANIDAKTSIANKTLGYAAMYSADRSVLKEIIAPKSKAKQTHKAPAASKIVEKPQKPVQKESDVPEVATGTKITFNTDDVAQSGADLLSKQVFSDLEALKASKSNYLHWLNMPDEEVIEQTPPKKKPETKKTESKTAAKPKQTQKKPKATKTKTASSTKVKSTTQKENTPKAKKTTTTKAKTKSTTSKKNSKKTTSKSASKKKNPNDQSDIIDKFIAKEPSITAKASRKSPNNQEDLSQPSTEFNEDLVSENLAKIMITQGKTDKAIDIYKKLIWKFPQKKAYFASQIEELKK